MTIDVDAIYEDGVLKPERPLQLAEKARVHVVIEVKAPPRPAHRRRSNRVEGDRCFARDRERRPSGRGREPRRVPLRQSSEVIFVDTGFIFAGVWALESMAG